MTRTSPLRPGAADRLAKLDHLLEQSYGTPESALGNQHDPLDEAIYIILTFQTDVPRARATWSRLRSIYRTWADLEGAQTAEIQDVLRQGGLQHQKARTLKRLLAEVRNISQELSLDCLKYMTCQAAERVLRRLPGLSWKGARCVLLYSLGHDTFPVDSNVFRILKRTGVLRSRAVYRRRSLHDALQTAVSPARRRPFHVNLVVHGQRVCLPRNPKCASCQVRSTCAMYGLSRKNDGAEYHDVSEGRRNLR